MAPTKLKMEVNPPEVVMDLSASTAPSATLTLTNTSGENLLFKVRTTNPKRYFVRPNQDLLKSGDKITVTIQLNTRDHTELVEKGTSDSDAPTKDKFMISSIAATEDMFARVKTAKEQNVKELQQVLSEIWSMQSKDDTSNRRLAVHFVYPKALNASSIAAGANGTAPSSAVKAPFAPTPAKPASAPSTTTVPPSTASTGASMTGVVAAHIQTPSKKAEEVVDTITSVSQSNARSLPSVSPGNTTTTSIGVGGDAELSFETLSKQYKDTLATLVQVTEERDRFQQKFKELSRELQQIRDESRAANKRLEGSGDASGTAVVKPGYQIWHLVLVALVSFLVAKLMELARDEALKGGLSASDSTQ